VEWQLYANRLKNDKADAMREMDTNRRDELVELARLRTEALQRVAEADEAFVCEQQATESLRTMRGGDWREQREKYEKEKRELGKRRTLNAKRMSEANLAEQRVKAATDARRRTEARVTEAWQSDAIVSAVDHDALRAELMRTQLQLEAQKEETAKYKAIAEPQKEYFFKSGHFSAASDLACIQCLQLHVPRRKVPSLFLVFSRLFRITMPRRDKKVPGPWVEGKRTSVVKTLVYVPGISHLKRMAGVMYQLNKLQVGEWLVLGLDDGDDDPTCAEHGTVNVHEEGRKADDKVLHEMMNISEEQARTLRHRSLPPARVRVAPLPLSAP
jgi:hypothetical protein